MLSALAVVKNVNGRCGGQRGIPKSRIKLTIRIQTDLIVDVVAVVDDVVDAGFAMFTRRSF